MHPGRIDSGAASTAIPARSVVPRAASDPSSTRQRGWIKPLVPKTTFGRSLLLIVMPLVLLQVIAAWVFYDRHWQAISYRLSSDVAGDITLLVEALHYADSDAERARLIARTAELADLTIELKSGAKLPPPLAPSGTMLERQLTEAMTSRRSPPFRVDAAGYPDNVRIEVQLPAAVLSVVVPRNRLFSSTTYIFIMWMVGSSLVLLGVAALFLRNQVKSLRRLAIAADALGKGRTVAFTKVEGALEVRQAAAAFMQMRDRIERQVSQRTEMLAGVSHDLRTPLTRMKLAVELMGDDPAVAELKSDVADMERLVDLYLDFARGAGTESPVETDIASLIEDLAASTRRDGTPLLVDQPSELVLTVRPHALRRCLANLIANARRYGQHVWLSSVPVEDGVDILIDDDGPGIAPADRDRVFQPFVRLDASRNPSTGGIGLGLTIARDVARSHGGDVRLEASPYGGLRARVHLPR